MTRKTIHHRRQQRRATQSAAHVYLPHSSWTHGARKPDANAPIEAEDFWERLGI